MKKSQKKIRSSQQRSGFSRHSAHSLSLDARRVSNVESATTKSSREKATVKPRKVRPTGVVFNPGGRKVDKPKKTSRLKRKEKRSAKKRSKELPARVVLAKFLKTVSAVKTPIYIGIDPGSHGAIGFLCGKQHCAIDIPIIQTKMYKTRRTTFKQRKLTGKKTRVVLSTQTDFDYEEICVLFGMLDPVKHRVRVILERIPPTIGPGRKYAEIMLNRAYMLWPLFLHSKNFSRVHQERPGVWKGELDLLGAEKTESLKLARKHFPLASLSRAKDHDRAEALLLAKYLRRVCKREEKAKNA